MPGATVLVDDRGLESALRHFQKVMSAESLKMLSADTRTHRSKGEARREKAKRAARKRLKAEARRRAL